MPGPLIVLIHGSMDRASSFAKVARRLREAGHQVAAYDRRGYASCVGFGPARSLADHVDDLFAVADGADVVAVGHSYGGDVALLAAATRPEQVQAIVAYETPLPWMDWWPSDTAGGQAAAAAADPEGAAERFMRRVIGDRLWDRLPERTKAARRADGPALISDMATIRGDAPVDLSAVGSAVIAGRGTKSAAHHRETAERLVAAVPHGELHEIEGAEHGAHVSHPDQFAAMVVRAVERAGARSG